MPVYKLCRQHGLYVGTCDPCYRQDNSRRAQKAKANGTKSAHWIRVRAARLALDRGACTFQLAGCTTRATTVHLAPELHGNHYQATVDNTRSACRHCHGVIDAPRSQPR